MARFVAEGANQVHDIQVRLKSVDQCTIEDLYWCDGIALGAPTHLGSIPWKLKKWWDTTAIDTWSKLDGKIGCVFSSAGGIGGGSELTCLGLLTVLMNYGFLVFGVTDYVAKQHTLHYGAAIAGEPRTEHEIAICQRLGRRLGDWVSYYCDRNEGSHPVPIRNIQQE